jgi:hypothetical protein
MLRALRAVTARELNFRISPTSLDPRRPVLRLAQALFLALCIFFVLAAIVRAARISARVQGGEPLIITPRGLRRFQTS